MDKINTKTFYVSADTHSKEKNISINPNSVFRQELTTWEYTDSGIKRTTVIRSFNGNKHVDGYISEPIALKLPINER